MDGFSERKYNQKLELMSSHPLPEEPDKFAFFFVNKTTMVKHGHHFYLSIFGLKVIHVFLFRQNDETEGNATQCEFL